MWVAAVVVVAAAADDVCILALPRGRPLCSTPPDAIPAALGLAPPLLAIGCTTTQRASMLLRGFAVAGGAGSVG